MKTYSRKNSSYLKKAFIASNFNEMCRLCLSEVDMVLTPIFRDYKISYRDWIQYSVDVLIEEGDGLPSNICEECLAMVEQTYLFKKKCKASDSKLREHMKLLEEKLNEKEERFNETILIDVNEDSKTLFAKERPNESKTDESNAVDTGGTETEEQNTKKLSEKESQTESESLIEDQPENSLPEDNVIINKVKKYILKEGDNEKDVTLCEVVSLCTRNDDLPPDETTDCILYANIESVDQNGHVNTVANSQKSGTRVQEIYQLWNNEEEEVKEASENIQGSENNEDVMILDVILEEQPDKNLKTLNAKIVQVSVEDDSVLSRQKVYSNKAPIEVVKKVTSDEGFKCMYCSKQFQSSLEQKEHLLKCYRRMSDSVKCKICSKTFTCMNSLKRHMSIHTGIKPFKCKVCGRNFSQSSILKRHLLTHESLKPFNCAICNKGYTQKMNLLSHLKNHGFRTETESFQCKICSKSFVHQSGLSRHVKLHKGIKFACPHCKKCFGDSSALSRHIKVIHKIS